MNQMDRGELSYGILNLTKMSKRCHIGIQTKVENFQNVPNPNFDLYVISLICTNLEAFTTFSTIFTHILLTSDISKHNTSGFEAFFFHFRHRICPMSS